MRIKNVCRVRQVEGPGVERVQGVSRLRAFRSRVPGLYP